MDSQSSTAGPNKPEFPAGLRVLLVDDDVVCLRVVHRMLEKCLYDVTTCSTAVKALEILREKKGWFDIVLSDVYMPDMDGFKLLEYIGLEMDLPVIMMSSDDTRGVVMKGVTHGACDYLIKPVSLEALKNIWQHVFRKKRNELKDMENSGSLEESEKLKKLEDGDNASSANNEQGSWKAGKRKKEGEEEDEFEDREDTSNLKKPRVVWSVDLHQQFVAAVNQLGLDKAVPKKILELMNNPVLTRENVASHLQKYRLYLKRLSVPQFQGRADTSFSSAPDASSFGSVSSVDGFDLQALAASGQLPPQALMSLHSGPRRPTNICMDMSTADQRGFFNSDAQLANYSKIRPTMATQMNNNHMNLLYVPSTSIEPRQIGQPPQAIRSYGNMGLQVSEGSHGLFNMPSTLRTSSSFSGGSINGHSTNSFVVQMNPQSQQVSLGQQQDHISVGVQRPQSRGQLFNGIASDLDSRVSSTMNQQMVSNVISNHMLVRPGTIINGATPLQRNYRNMSPYGTVSPALYHNGQNNSINVLNCHPHNSALAVNSISPDMLQEAGTGGPGGLEALNNVTSFDNDHLSKNQEWKLQNINYSYESSQLHGAKQSNIDYGSSVATHQDFNTVLKDGAARNTCTVRKEIVVRTEIEHDVSQNTLFDDDIFPDELIGVFGRQQEAAGQGDPDFNFERYSFEA